MNTSVSYVENQDTSITARLRAMCDWRSDLSDDLVGILSLLTNEALITHAMLDAIDALKETPTGYSRFLSKCFDYASQTLAWQDENNIPYLFNRLMAHKNTCQLSECLALLSEEKLLSLSLGHMEQFMNHTQLDCVYRALQQLLVHDVCTADNISMILQHDALEDLVTALYAQHSNRHDLMSILHGANQAVLDQRTRAASAMSTPRLDPVLEDHDARDKTLVTPAASSSSHEDDLRTMNRQICVRAQETTRELLVNFEDYRTPIEQWIIQDTLNQNDRQCVDDLMSMAAQLHALLCEDSEEVKGSQYYWLQCKFVLKKNEFMKVLMRQQVRTNLQALSLMSLYDTVINSMDLQAFIQLYDLIFCSATLSHVRGSVEFWRSLVLPQGNQRWYWQKDSTNLGDLVTLLIHPQMGPFFQKNISQLIKKRREPLRAILNFLTHAYTQPLFTCEDGEYFCGGLLKLSNGGLKTKFEILKRLSHSTVFVGEVKKTLVSKVLEKKGALHQFKEAVMFFPEVLKQSKCDPMDLLNTSLMMPQPGALMKLLICLPFRFAELFPSATPEELTIMHMVNTDSMYSKLEHVITSCCDLLLKPNKKLLLSMEPQDVEFKFELLRIYDRSSAHVQSALRKLCEFNLLNTGRKKNLATFDQSPHREIMAYVFLASDFINPAIFRLIFTHADRLCTNESLNTWRQIPADALTLAHIQHLVTFDDPDLLITYLTDRFNLGGVAGVARAVEVNYDQSIHNSAVERSITESSKKLLARYLPVLALTARSTASMSDLVRVDSTSRALTFFYERGAPDGLKQVHGKEHWNEINSLCYQEMRQWLSALPDEVFKQHYIKCFERLQHLQYIRKESKVSMTTLFALIWILIHDETLRIGSLEDALGTFKAMLYEIQRGYNIVPHEDHTRPFTLVRVHETVYRDDELRDDPICTGGTFNKGIEKFNAMHPDLHVYYKTFNTATMKFAQLVRETVVDYALKSCDVDGVRSILTDGVACIWDKISPTIAAHMLDEFGDLYQSEGEHHEQFIGLMSAGPDVDVSDVEALNTFVAQAQVSRAKRSLGLFASASNDDQPDEHPNQWRRLDDDDPEDNVAVKVGY